MYNQSPATQSSPSWIVSPDLQIARIDAPEKAMPKRSTLRLTSSFVKALQTDGRDAFFWDHQLAGFGVRVPRGRRQVELVERGTAAEGERPGENRIGEYLDQGPADDEVLLDLEVLVPGRLRPPLGDVVPRDHASASMLAFTNSRQSCDRGASVASAPGRSFV